MLEHFLTLFLRFIFKTQNFILLFLVLNKRLDDRVDKMIEQGLVAELLEFHKNFNESRIKEGK